MDVQNLTVGPIIGHSSSELVRIFGRAKLSIHDDRPRKTHGVIKYRKNGESDFSTPAYFKMNPNFDLTGVIVLMGLEENTTYDYQIGWFYSEVDSKEIDVQKVLNWENVDTYKFKTGSSDSSKPRNLIFGSCRYALRLLGGMWWDDRGDKAFKSILEQKENGKHVDQLIMCGDQIYADDLKVIGSDDSLDEYNKRYQKVFTTPYIRKLMSCTPTYMMLDDHEIEDNWPESASAKDWVTKFPAAIHAYTTYQASHSPLFELKGSHITGTPTHLWYKYADGCCDFFVCDTRTERNLDKDSREIIGPRQMKELLSWLCDDSSRVKFIITSVPPYESESSDKWFGYISQRDEILECIRINGITKVVFLSGDVHACMASQLELNETSTVTSVVSSSLFWPYPHPNRRSFKLSGHIDTSTASKYKVVKASSVYPTDAFTKLYVTPEKIRVDFYSRKGDKLGSKSYKLN
ncbi:MAG: alkaline phosphatase D family protein [Paraglaciecola sp.]|uniref:alkaline phosphatase D family protein n=1 Tax=Paraglaciecola sp. TaxID=1920173 RepID=UPI003298CDDF